MFRRGLLLIALLCFASVLQAQSSSPPPPADFAGTWKAEFHKKTWLTLTLISEHGQLTGSLTHSTQISADDEGDITRVDDEMTTDKVVHTELRGGTLHLRMADVEGIEDEYDLKLVDAENAELQPAAAEGQSAPKAFKLKRAPKQDAVR